ncbi:MAG: uracil phosphoribosyltransferase [Candidatus Dadabacteria bacterium]|nr:MAG: uracil phosphoribosyltransferase [Candidatus Dadabacteria bacterium]
MLYDLSKTDSLISHYISEIRDVNIQNDRKRFRDNLHKIAAFIGYELSKTLEFETKQVKTPLGTAQCRTIKSAPVLATILRAGLAMHSGLLEAFDSADNAFISAYRKHDDSGGFRIKLEYVSCPDLTGRVLIVSDPMLATGASMVLTVKELLKEHDPKEIHIVTAIAAEEGIEAVRKGLPDATLWAAAVDPELNDKAYIVPGLGDAGDLAFGPKIQN